jgi:hypothetical protein
MVGWDGIEPPTPDFQTRQHPPARTISLLLAVVIRSLQVTGPHLCLRIRTDADA